MPDDRDTDLPGSDDPTRLNDPVDPTRVHQPVDTSDAQGAGPAAGMGRREGRFEPLEQGPRRSGPAGDSNRTGLLWALLAAVVIGIVLFALVDRGDDGDAVDTIDPVDTAVPEAPVEDTVAEDPVIDTSAPEDTTATSEAPESTTTTADEGATPSEGGIATADGTDLLSVLEGDADDAERLAPYAGEDVTASGVEVMEVVEGQGIWIGTSDEQRIFARTTEAVPVEAGDEISFDGTLEENADEGSDDAIVLPDDQGAEQLRQQGHHIELSEVTPA